MAGRLLIVNADDFGISEGVNLGIVEAHRRGILTSTTVMANMPAFEHAAQLWPRHSSLAVGVHLNLTTGAPVLPRSQVPTLLGEDGRLPGVGRVLRGLSLGRLDSRQLEEELSAQAERALGAGFSPTHLDSHHHLHAHPVLHRIVVRIALRYGLRGIRCPIEVSPGGAVRHAGMLLKELPLPVGEGRGEGETSHLARTTDRTNPPAPREPPRAIYLKAVVLSVLGRLLRLRVRRAGLTAPDHFRGLLLGLAFSTEDLQELLQRLPAGSTELMCHPGYPDLELGQRTSYSSGRDSELRALVDPANRALLDRAGVRLGSYADLARE